MARSSSSAAVSGGATAPGAGLVVAVAGAPVAMTSNRDRPIHTSLVTTGSSFLRLTPAGYASLMSSRSVTPVATNRPGVGATRLGPSGALSRIDATSKDGPGCSADGRCARTAEDAIVAARARVPSGLRAREIAGVFTPA